MNLNLLVVLLLSLIAVGVIALNLWSRRDLNRLRKDAFLNDKQLNDSKYWELKYRIEFVITVFSIGAAIFLFVGYNGIDSIKQKLSTEIKVGIDTSMRRIDTVEYRLKKIDTESNATEQNIKSVITSGNKGLNDYQSRLEELKSQLNAIQNKNIIRQDIFIVKDLPYEFANDEWKDKKFYFKNLRSVNNELLPSFKRPPFIIAYNDQGLIFTVKKVTTESFVTQISHSASQEDYPNPTRFTIWITVIE